LSSLVTSNSTATALHNIHRKNKQPKNKNHPRQEKTRLTNRFVSRWSEVKSAVSAILGVGVGDRELMNALNSLVGYNFVERRGRGEYGIADPILRQVDMVPLLRRYLRREANV